MPKLLINHPTFLGGEDGDEKQTLNRAYGRLGREKTKEFFERERKRESGRERARERRLQDKQ